MSIIKNRDYSGITDGFEETNYIYCRELSQFRHIDLCTTVCCSKSINSVPSEKWVKSKQLKCAAYCKKFNIKVEKIVDVAKKRRKRKTKTAKLEE